MQNAKCKIYFRKHSEISEFKEFREFRDNLLGDGNKKNDYANYSA